MDITLFSVVTHNHNVIDHAIASFLAWTIIFAIVFFVGWLWRKFGGNWQGLDKKPPVLKKNGEDNTIPPTE